MRKSVPAAVLLGSCVTCSSVWAVDIGGDTTIGGVAYADVSHISLQNENKGGVSTDSAPTGTGFDVKRFYLIVNHRFDEVWSANLTTEAEYSTASTTTVTTPTGTATALTSQNTSGGVTEVFIKKLYLQGAFNQAFVVRLGSSDLPWVKYVEDLSAHRWVENEMLARLGLGTSADWGLNASGVLGNGEIVSYSASVVDGGGFKNPTRTEKVDFEGRLGIHPADWLTAAVGFYSGHLGQITATNDAFPSNTATRLDGLLHVKFAGLHVGGQYFSARNYKTVNSAATAAFGTSAIVTSTGAAPVSDRADGFSSWAWYDFTDQWSLFGRYDDAKISKDVAPDLKDTYFNVGVAYKPIRALDFALVYKSEKVQNGSATLNAADALGTYVVGGATGHASGTFEELGVYAQWRF